MKIEFLDESLTSARLTRGFWWWKRAAEIKRDDSPPLYGSKWSFVVSGHKLGDYDSCVIESRRDGEIEARRVRQDWQPVRALPKAVLK